MIDRTMIVNLSQLGLKSNTKSWTSAYKSHALYIRRRGKFTKGKTFRSCASVDHIRPHIPICIGRSKRPGSDDTDILHFDTLSTLLYPGFSSPRSCDGGQGRVNILASIWQIISIIQGPTMDPSRRGRFIPSTTGSTPHITSTAKFRFIGFAMHMKNSCETAWNQNIRTKTLFPIASEKHSHTSDHHRCSVNGHKYN